MNENNFKSETHVRCPQCYLIFKRNDKEINTRLVIYYIQKCLFCLYEFKIEKQADKRTVINKKKHDYLMNGKMYTTYEDEVIYLPQTVYISPPLLEQPLDTDDDQDSTNKETYDNPFDYVGERG